MQKFNLWLKLGCSAVVDVVSCPIADCGGSFDTCGATIGGPVSHVL